MSSAGGIAFQSPVPSGRHVICVKIDDMSLHFEHFRHLSRGRRAGLGTPRHSVVADAD